MHADGKSTLASVSKWNSGKVNLACYVSVNSKPDRCLRGRVFAPLFCPGGRVLNQSNFEKSAIFALSLKQHLFIYASSLKQHMFI